MSELGTSKIKLYSSRDAEKIALKQALADARAELKDCKSSKRAIERVLLAFVESAQKPECIGIVDGTR